MNQPAASTRKLMKIAESAMAKHRGQEAWNALQQVLKTHPNHVEALHLSGFILLSAGHYDQARHYLQQATYFDPQHFESYCYLLRILEAEDRGQEALQLANHMVQVMPDNPKAYTEMVAQLMRFNQTHMVPSYIEGILPRFADNADLLMQYALALKINRRYDEADKVYHDATARHRIPAESRLLYELFLPRNYESSEEIDRIRAQWAASIEKFIHERPRFPIGRYLVQPVFQLAYHNRDNKALVQRYTAMYRAISPELNYVAPHCRGNRVRREGPVRIGFVSRFMHNHSVGNSFRSLMIHLGDQADFAVTFFNLSNVVDHTTKEIVDSKVNIVSLPKAIESIQTTIAAAELDIMVFPDIGMDAMTHYVALARLAPHQIVMHGHPETTGIDTMDYYLSSQGYEAPGAQANYSEQLLCTPSLVSIFKKPTPPATWLSRAELNLPEGKKLYVCPMAIQKFHPDFDLALAGILKADPEAVIVLFNDFQQQATSDFLRERILRHCDASRVIFMPWLPLEALFSVLKTADALLDTFYFGGGTTIQYAFGFGLPVVSMPTRYVRGRVVLCYYDIFGVDNAPLANSPEEYVTLAVKLAHDTQYRAQLGQQLLANGYKMFEQNPSGDDIANLMRGIMKGELGAYAPA